MLISKYFADIKEPIASSFDMLSYKTYGYSQMSQFGNSADTYHHSSNGSLNRFTMFASFTVFRTLRVIRMTGSNEPPSPLPSLVVLTPTKQSTDHTIVQIHRLVLSSFTIVYLVFIKDNLFNDFHYFFIEKSILIAINYFMLPLGILWVLWSTNMENLMKVSEISITTINKLR